MDTASEYLDERTVRLNKLSDLKARGVNPYPATNSRTATNKEAVENFDTWSQEAKSIVLVGRLRSIRLHGGMCFANIEDETAQIQILLKKDVIGDDAFTLFEADLDVGDFIEASGTLFLTKKGEKTLTVETFKILTKAILPLPEKWHGLADVEMRFRQRELDLISNPEVKQRFIVRSKMVTALRTMLDTAGFLEVETPILQPIPGGANARPFITHYNALDADFYLRISPELYLKRLLVGGFDKVYEIGRCFRNEGIDHAHNPEFTMLELYWAYAEKENFFEFLEQMLTQMITAGIGALIVTGEEGEINFTAPFPRLTFRQAVLDATGIDIDTLATPEEVVSASDKAGLKIDFSRCVGLGEHFDELWKKAARPLVKNPTWILDYPLALKPLARVHPEDPTKSATTQLVVMGAEIFNAYYHELNDPTDQRERFEQQQGLREKGSSEAQWMDEAFVTALEHGMPPACGVGLGIDRLVTLVTGAPGIKEVILFPSLKPKE